MLRPIDMAITVQHAADAARAGATQSRPEVAQQQFTERLDKQLKMQEQQVQQTNEADKNAVNADAKGHGGGYQPKKKQGQKKEAAKTETKRHQGESLYDIMA